MDGSSSSPSQPEFSRGLQDYANHSNCPYHPPPSSDFTLLPPCNVFYYLAARHTASSDPQCTCGHGTHLLIRIHESKYSASNNMAKDLSFLQSITDASLLGDLQKVNALHKAAQSNGWSTPIQLVATAATERQHPEILKYCLENGAKVDSDIDVASARDSSPRIYKVLLSTGSWPSYPYSLDSVLNRDVTKGSDIVRFLLDEGAAIGIHTLSLASGANNTVDTLALLLSRGAQLHDSGALQYAAMYNRLLNVKYLLDQGARLDEIPATNPGDERDCDNGTALHRAVYGSAVEVVEFLLGEGADMRILDEMGRTPMMIAERRKGEEKMKKIIELLKDAEANH